MNVKASKILVVEDEAIIALDIDNQLKKLGYDVVGITSTGRNAVEMARTNKPDLILMDIMLQGDIDGIQAAEEISQFADTPVIYLTAYSDNDTINRIKDTSPFAYLLKPFKEKELHTAVEIALFRFSKEKEAKESQQWLNAVLESLGEGIVAIDNKDKIKFINKTAESILKCTEEADLGEHYTKVFNIQEITTPNSRSKSSDLDFHNDYNITLNANLTLQNGNQIPIEYIINKIKGPKNDLGKVIVFKDITTKKYLEEKMINLAYYDQLTGMPNRANFMETLELEVENVKLKKNEFCLIFVDLDKFKNVNDSFGHGTGDILLKEVANKIGQCIYKGDFAARLSGDEFTVIMKNPIGGSLAEYQKRCNAILNALSESFIINSYAINVYPSIGMSLCPLHSTKPDELLVFADRAMYKAKNNGGNRCEIYSID